MRPETPAPTVRMVIPGARFGFPGRNQSGDLTGPARADLRGARGSLASAGESEGGSRLDAPGTPQRSCIYSLRL